MADYHHPYHPSEAEHLRLEAVVPCVGFDDILDVTLALNHPHLDTVIVVTDHADRATQQVAKKHGAICVQTDLYKKNGRSFNKGAAVNSGFNRFQYHGWRLLLDADIVLPDNFRRVLFNHTHLDRSAIYGADRVDVIGVEELLRARAFGPQCSHGAWVHSCHHRTHGQRYVDPLIGYVPIGYFQLWNASCQKEYPFSLGTAAHDDTMFAEQWPRSHRHLLPTAICYHLCARLPQLGENWNGRTQPRIDAKSHHKH